MATHTEKRDRLFSGYDRGIVTASEVVANFIDLLVECDSDADAVNLCDGTPQWFRDKLGSSLDRWAATDYFVRSFYIGDTRTPEQVEADAKRVQSCLRDLAPKINAVL